MNIDALGVAIAAGEYDDRLADIVAMVSARRQTRGAQLAVQLNQGDRVRVTAYVRPKYLAGATGVVRGRTGSRVTVDLDERVGRFHRDVDFQPTTLERISNAHGEQF